MGTDNIFTSRDYFSWLCNRISIPEGREYTTILNIMFGTEFVWVVGNDENRIADGRNLRLEYHPDRREPNADINSEPVKFLEVLIALSERVAFLVDQPAPNWAWNLIRNIKLSGFDDPLDGREVRKVMDILENVIWRRYAADGGGGFFPLTRPKNDQRQAEIWDQMNAYIQENRASFGL